MELIKAAQAAIDTKDLESFENIWMEMVLTPEIPLSEFFKYAKQLRKLDQQDCAYMLLDMLASHLRSNSEYQKSIDVYKQMLYYTKDNIEVRENIEQVYRTKYTGSEKIDKYLELSGLSGDKPIFKALNRLEEFLEFDIGKNFFFERYGMGTVIDTNPEKNEVIIDFEKRKKHFLSIDVARGLLMPINEEHFLYLKYSKLEHLKELIQQDPLQLTKKILKDFPEPLTASQIKKHFEGITEKPKINRLWNSIKKQLEKDPTIKITGRTVKTYSYTETGVDKEAVAREAFNKASDQEKYIIAQEHADKNSPFFKNLIPELIKIGNRIYEKNAVLALDILMLGHKHGFAPELNYQIEEIVDRKDYYLLLDNLNSAEHQRQLLDRIQTNKKKNWIKIFKSLILKITDNRVLDELSQRLKPYPEEIKDIYFTIISVPKNYPVQYTWILKKIQAGQLQEYTEPSYIPKIIDSLNYIKGIKSIVLKILDLKTFDKILAQAKEDEAQRIYQVILRSEGLKEYQKNSYQRIIEHHHPHLLSPDTDIIYTTKIALKKQKDILDHIMNVEIPKNKKDISKAREFGDLSENFEYKAAKEKQHQLHEKLRVLQQELARAAIIKSEDIKTDTVSIGTRITLRDSMGKDSCYTILGKWDTDLPANIISYEAPVATLLLGKKIGDAVTINKIAYTVVKIEKGI